MGDIHKLITLDSPHSGSEIASALIDENGAETALGRAVRDHLGCVLCGAVSDLSVGSQLLSQMPTVRVPSHALVGIGGEKVIRDANIAAPVLDTPRRCDSQ